MGDLNKRRGRVMGMNPTGDGETVLEAEVPMAEMMSYAIDLRSMTQSRGTFTFNFVRYEDCPAAAQEKPLPRPRLWPMPSKAAIKYAGGPSSGVFSLPQKVHGKFF